MITIEREPASPGEILQEEFLTPLEISQKQLAVNLFRVMKKTRDLPHPIVGAG